MYHSGRHNALDCRSYRIVDGTGGVKMSARIYYYECQKCGCDELMHEAEVIWDVDDQCFVVESVDTWDAYCPECDAEVHVDKHWTIDLNKAEDMRLKDKQQCLEFGQYDGDKKEPTLNEL
jgi:hypothetical protein